VTTFLFGMWEELQSQFRRARHRPIREAQMASKERFRAPAFVIERTPRRGRPDPSPRPTADRVYEIEIHLVARTILPIEED
jgi:hypothetical protein